MRASRILSPTTILVLVLAACQAETAPLGVEPPSGTLRSAQAHGSTASIDLADASATLTLTGDHTWTLTKTGSISGSTVTWNITAANTATVGGQLVVQGQLTVTNSGAGAATIGNILVNLQTRVGHTWQTASSDVADATDGDAATTAKIYAAASSEHQSSFSENAASGSLQFMDATNNTILSLVPELMIAAGQTRSLLFQATFDNNVLLVATGTPISSEVIVSFGNATVQGNSTPDLDINGNGVIDADEAHVRSVPTRLGLTVPEQTAGTAEVTLSDALADITTTGTVTHGSVGFNLGATGGTVTTTVDGGASGGRIRNCAHLTSPGQTVSSGGVTFTPVGALDLEACNTVDVDGNPTCTAGTAGCGWHAGDLATHTQFGWDISTSWFTQYLSVYSSTFGVVEVGIPGTSGFSMRFSSPNQIVDYFIASGPIGPLTSDVNDPTATSTGTFGGELLALRMNVDFSATGALPGSSTTKFGSLTLCGMSDASLDGQTVGSVLDIGNTLLGGGSNGYSISAISTLAAQLNSAFEVAFDNGTPTIFAQDHLFVGACP